jgi:hypothetical protein
MNRIKTSSAVVFAGVLSISGLFGATLCTAADAPAGAAAHQPPDAEARIAFADHHGIYNWQVLNDKTMLVQSQDHKWYKATLMGHCNDLPFAEDIGFKTNADGSFDKFSSISVRRQNCPLLSLVETAAPVKKDAANKPANPPHGPPANKL